MSKRERLPNFKLAGAIEYKGQKLDTDVVFAEDKLDGLRMVVVVRDGKAIAYTRNGIEIPNAKFITDAIEKRFKHSGVFDGEGIATDWNLTQSVMMTQTYDKKLADLLRYRTFDFLTIREWDKKACYTTLAERKDELKELIATIRSPRMSYLPHNLLEYTKSEINKFMRVRAAAGLEGGVFKVPQSFYSFRKNKDWLKLKPYKECDALCTGKMQPGKKGKTGQMLNLVGSVEVKCKIDGKKIKFNTSGMDMDVRRQLTNLYEANRLKGIVVEVRHEGVTVKDKVRFPRITRVRFDKEKP